jgi:hypothetical protein
MAVSVPDAGSIAQPVIPNGCVTPLYGAGVLIAMIGIPLVTVTVRFHVSQVLK